MELRRIYLLDTNIISEGIKPVPNPNVVTKMESTSYSAAICAPVWYELLRGINILPEGSRKDTLEKYALKTVQGMYPILPYDSHCASLHAAIFAKMRKNGTPVSQLDSQIAATALANNMIVVTRNTKDFEPIQQEYSLCVENWFD